MNSTPVVTSDNKILPSNEETVKVPDVDLPPAATGERPEQDTYNLLGSALVNSSNDKGLLSDEAVKVAAVDIVLPTAEEALKQDTTIMNSPDDKILPDDEDAVKVLDADPAPPAAEEPPEQDTHVLSERFPPNSPDDTYFLSDEAVKVPDVVLRRSNFRLDLGHKLGQSHSIRLRTLRPSRTWPSDRVGSGVLRRKSPERGQAVTGKREFEPNWVGSPDARLQNGFEGVSSGALPGPASANQNAWNHLQEDEFVSEALMRLPPPADAKSTRGRPVGRVESGEADPDSAISSIRVRSESLSGRIESRKYRSVPSTAEKILEQNTHVSLESLLPNSPDDKYFSSNMMLEVEPEPRTGVERPEQGTTIANSPNDEGSGKVPGAGVPLMPPTAEEILDEKIAALLAEIHTDYILFKSDIEPQGTDKTTTDMTGGYSNIDFITIKPKPSPPNRSVSKVAVKKLKREKEDVKDHFKLVAAREAYVWYKLQPHENILEFTGYMWEFNDKEPERVWFVSPWLEYGTAPSYLKGASLSTWDVKRLEILDGACKGLKHIHGQNPPIAHGDIKPENILITFVAEPETNSLRLRAVLCDFGRSRVAGNDIYDHTKTKEIPPGPGLLTSPEDLKREHIMNSCGDMWSFGWVVWEVMTGSPSWPDLAFDWSKVMWAIKNRPHPLLKGENLLALARLTNLKSSMDDCWRRKPEERADADSCLKGIQDTINTVKALTDEQKAENDALLNAAPAPPPARELKALPKKLKTVHPKKAVTKAVDVRLRPGDTHPTLPSTMADAGTIVKALDRSKTFWEYVQRLCCWWR